MASAKVRVSGNLVGRIRVSSTAAIGRDILRRAKHVEGAAKKRISSAPRRVDTGLLRASIHVTMFRYRETWGARIGSGVEYALYVHNGTGIYGPRHMPITPKRSSFLRFTPKGGKGVVYAKSVIGMRPNPYLKDGLRAARG